MEEDAIDASNLYVRDDYCIIVDEESLVTLEALSGKTPDPGPCELVSEDGGFMESPQDEAWVWILDRDYYEEFVVAAQHPPSEARLPPHGITGERRFDPWARIYISDLILLWFHRPYGYYPSDRGSRIARDKEKFDKVN